ncbi:MAG: four helix bundle protein [Candidatus Shapirobacteria bacterium]|jgi:four helix bundle protein
METEQNSFENLRVWQLSHQLTVEVYKATKTFPPEEKYSLTDQVKRSSSSVATNIVEGNERQTKKEYIQFLYTSKGSLAETKYHLLLAKDLGYIKILEYNHLIEMSNQIGKMLNSLIKYLKSKI